MGKQHNNTNENENNNTNNTVNNNNYNDGARSNYGLLWGALLVVAAPDPENVALELLADGVAWHLGRHALVEEREQLLVVLAPRTRSRVRWYSLLAEHLRGL